MNLKLKFAAAVVGSLLCSILAFGQGSASGDLHVIVKDPKGSVITSGTVTAREQAKGFMRSTTQNAEGEYRLVSLPPGMYTVTARSIFKSSLLSVNASSLPCGTPVRGSDQGCGFAPGSSTTESSAYVRAAQGSGRSLEAGGSPFVT